MATLEYVDPAGVGLDVLGVTPKERMACGPSWCWPTNPHNGSKVRRRPW